MTGTTTATTDVEPCPACHPQNAPGLREAGADQSGSAPLLPKTKPCHVGAPAIFALELACKELRAAFGGLGPYLVGSSLDRADWRDVDVRYMLRDEEFAALFPDACMSSGAAWEFDARWLWLSTSISERLSRLTGLPIDFQFQPMTFANERHKKSRHALGLKFAKG